MIAGARTVRVRCPAQSRGGHFLQITVPPDPVVRPNVQGPAVLTSATPGAEGGGAVAMSESAREANAGVAERDRRERAAGGAVPPPSGDASDVPAGDSPPEPEAPTTYMVTVPQGISPGMHFAVEVEGQRMSE